jgi:hypothetical protein
VCSDLFEYGDKELCPDGNGEHQTPRFGDAKREVLKEEEGGDRADSCDEDGEYRST